ncbi:hypothetical protein [Microbacterium resistens]
MNRRLTVLALAGATVFGLTACAGGSGTGAGTAPAGQSVADACKTVTSALAEDTGDIASLLGTAATDPQASVDSVTKIADKLSAAVAEVGNADVKAAVEPLAADYAKLGELLTKSFVDQDPTAAGELGTVSTSMTEHLKAFTDVCTG